MKSQMQFTHKEETVIIPPGQWLVHATPSVNEKALGSAKSGVIIAPINIQHIPAPIYMRVLLPHKDDAITILLNILSEYYGSNYSYLSILASYIPMPINQLTHSHICTTFVSYYILQAYQYNTQYAQSPVALYNSLMVMDGVSLIGKRPPPSVASMVVGFFLFLFLIIASFI